MGSKHSTVAASDLARLRASPSSYLALLPADLLSGLIATYTRVATGSPLLGLGRNYSPSDVQSTFAGIEAWRDDAPAVSARLWQRLGPCTNYPGGSDARRAVAIRRLARDLYAVPLYPEMRAPVLVKALQACSLPSDQGLIAVQYLDNFVGAIVLVLCVLDTCLVWATAAGARHTISYETLRRGGAVCAHTHPRPDTNFVGSAEGAQMRLDVGAANAMPAHGSERWITLLTALTALLMTEPAE